MRWPFGKSARTQASGDAPRWLDISAFDVVYAIGDVHGCYRLAQTMEEEIAIEIAAYGDDPERSLILYLGDVVDRGPMTAHLLDMLTQPNVAGLARHVLRGNHEDMMLGFMDAPSSAAGWLEFGGMETLNSYGLYLSDEQRDRIGARQWQQLIDANIPAAHIAFLRELPHAADAAPYLFVHAGVDPLRPITAQTPQDFMWSREGFMIPTGHWDRIVVHGHTPLLAPQITPMRISLDTNAYATGLLTAARVDLRDPKGKVQFLHLQ